MRLRWRCRLRLKLRAIKKALSGRGSEHMSMCVTRLQWRMKTITLLGMPGSSGKEGIRHGV